MKCNKCKKLVSDSEALKGYFIYKIGFVCDKCYKKLKLNKYNPKYI